jgi:hypothetical protein
MVAAVLASVPSVSLTILAAAEPVVDGPAGSALAQWWPLWAFGGVFAAAVVALAVLGRGAPGGPLLWVPAALERVSGVPGWAASTFALAVYGLAVAGYGFYTDVAYHVAYGRDDELFTAPHTAIFVGLCLIAAAPVAGVVVATLERRPTALRLANLRIPRSTVPLGVLGAAALIGFPVDELWHQQYGVDVTMWSPPHLIMILGASFSGLASWLVLAEAGVRSTDGVWGRALHLVSAALVLQGLSSVQGEFSFGVPQWQQLYHPVLVCLAAGAALTIIRLVHGPGWALGIAAVLAVAGSTELLGGGDPIDTRSGALYLGSALAVEVVARALGTERRLRFALATGAGVATLGLAAEWAWNQGAHQPWTAALLPEAFLVGALAALSAAVIGTALGGAITGSLGVRPVPAVALAVALVGVLASLAIPFPRQVGDVVATVELDWVDENRAVVEVTLEPPDAAEGARWFTAGSWQWGGRTILHMQDAAPGRYSSVEPLLLTGWAKSLVRLHRGAEMMAVPVRLPADDAYDLAEVPAVDRRVPFVSEQRFLQREASDDLGWFATVVYALVTVLAAAWVAALWWAAAGLGRRDPSVPDAREREPAVT